MLSLNYFVGKFCTIFTQDSGFPFKDGLEYANYFSGVIIQVDDKEGIFLKNPLIGTIAFYPFKFITALVEEQYLPEGDPKAEKIKEDLKPKPKVKPNETFVESLQRIVRVPKDGQATL